MQKWRQSYRACRREKKEEAATLRKQVTAAWRPYGSNLSPWEQIELRPLHKSSKEKWEQHKGRWQEEKKDEGIVKMNKSKAEPISSWCYQRQAGSIKVLRRAVWSLIFFVFGVHLVKAEVQEDQAHKGIAREVHPDLQDGIPRMRKRMTMWEEWCLNKRERKNSQGRDPSTPNRNSQGKDTRTCWPLHPSSSLLPPLPSHLPSTHKYTARERTREPGKHQLGGGELRRSAKKRSGKERRK